MQDIVQFMMQVNVNMCPKAKGANREVRALLLLYINDSRQ
jgi:hypothetical protein